MEHNSQPTPVCSLSTDTPLFIYIAEVNNVTKTEDLQTQKILTVGGWGNNPRPDKTDKKSELRAGGGGR